MEVLLLMGCCSLSDKDTKLKANHNDGQNKNFRLNAVPYRTKILN